MARLSPITIGLSGLMVIFLGATIFLVVRPRDDADLSLLSSPPAPPAPAPEIAPAPPPPPPAPPQPIPAPEPAAVVETVAAESDAQPSAETAPAPALGRRGLLVVNHNRRLQEADEQVFVTLNLAETTRAEVRRINEEYRKRSEVDPTQAGGAGLGSAGIDSAGTAPANTARQDALRLLLGAVPAREFEAAERGAVLRLRGKYRFEWGRQLRQ
jgi:hypothetical protein